jgi:hypothetical protein
MSQDQAPHSKGSRGWREDIAVWLREAGLELQLMCHPQDDHVLIPRTWDCGTLPGGRDFANGVWLKVSR